MVKKSRFANACIDKLTQINDVDKMALLGTVFVFSSITAAYAAVPSFVYSINETAT
jgi:hypothetical protein